MSTGYRRPTNVAVVVDASKDGDVVYLSALPYGSLLVLRGSGALIWQQAVAGHPDVVSRLAARVGVEPDAIRGDVEGFLTQLLDQGLLERD